YKTQWQITFKQTGIGGDTGPNTVVTVAGSPKVAGDFDYTTWVDDSSPLSFSWAATLATSPASGKRYAFVSSSPATLPSVTSAVTVAGTYKTQWQVTFKQTGIGGDTGSNTVVTVNGTPHPIADFDVMVWVDDTTGSATFGYAATVAASAGKQYVLSNSASLSSPITSVTAAMTVRGGCK